MTGGSTAHSPATLYRKNRLALCHPDRVAASRDMCQPCYKKWLKCTDAKDRPPREKRRRGVLSAPATCHPDQPVRALGLCQACYLKQYRVRNLEKLRRAAREKDLFAKYGITAALRREIYEAQGGACAICRKPIPERGTKNHLDHCHATGVIRGILCNTCNWFLSRIDADPEMIERIKSHRSKVWSKPKS